MQVSVETTGDLERRLTIQIPAERIEQEVDSRLRSLERTAKVAGFRPGKVPFKVLQLKYEGRIREEVVSAVIESSYKDALTQQNLRPVNQPKIEPMQMQAGQDLKYTALIEVYPELMMLSTQGIAVQQPVAEITESDIDAMLEVLRKQRASWQDVSRAVREGDRVVINYSATMGDAEKPFMEEKQATIIVGSKGNLEEFEARLVGLNPGETTSFDQTYPAMHPEQQLAGKPLQFQVSIVAVAEPILPDLDDQFAGSFGISEGGIANLRKEVAANMSREMTGVIKARVKEQVLEGLLSANPIKSPSSMVDDEINRLISAAERDGQPKQALSREVFHAQATRRVGLGLLISEIVKSNRIAIDPARVRHTIETIAASYEEPEQVVKWYYGNRELLSGIESLVLEDQVVDWLLERAEIQQVPTNFQTLMNPAH